MKNLEGMFEELSLTEKLYDGMFSIKVTDKCTPDKKKIAQVLSGLIGLLVAHGVLTADEVADLTQTSYELTDTATVQNVPFRQDVREEAWRIH